MEMKETSEDIGKFFFSFWISPLPIIGFLSRVSGLFSNSFKELYPKSSCVLISQMQIK